MRSAASGRCCSMSVWPWRKAAVAPVAELRRVGILTGLFICQRIRRLVD